ARQRRGLAEDECLVVLSREPGRLEQRTEVAWFVVVERLPLDLLTAGREEVALPRDDHAVCRWVASQPIRALDRGVARRVDRVLTPDQPVPVDHEALGDGWGNESHAVVEHAEQFVLDRISLHRPTQ